MQISLIGVLANGASTPSTWPSKPFEQAIDWPIGEDGTVIVTIEDPAGVAANLTGGSVSLGVRRLPSDVSPALLRLAVLTDPTNGVATVAIAAADTASWFSERHTFDVWYTDAAGKRYQVVPASDWMPLPVETLSGEVAALAPTVVVPGQQPLLFVSDEIDLTVPATGILIARGAPGKYLVPHRWSFIQTLTNGTAVTGSGTIRMGSNAGHSNVLSDNVFFATAATFPNGPGYILNTSPPNVVGTPLGADIRLDIPIAAVGTGAFAYRCKIALLGFYM